MKISWLGGSTIRLENGKHVAALNPLEKAHLKNASLAVFDMTDKKNSSPGDSLMIDWPGEYDTSGFAFKGVEVHGKEKSSTIFNFHSPKGHVAWMGNLADHPSDKEVEALGEVDVLILPVGAGDVLDAKVAFKLVEKIEPMVVIPICYGAERQGLQAFIKEMDVNLPEPKKSFEFKKSVLGSESLELVILEEV